MNFFFWSKTKQISARDAKALLDSDEAIAVDVRRPKDQEESHIFGAILADKNTVHEALDPALKNKTIICYCYRGVSSRTACKNLSNAGFTRVLNLRGGYAAWKKCH